MNFSNDKHIEVQEDCTYELIEPIVINIEVNFKKNWNVIDLDKDKVIETKIPSDFRENVLFNDIVDLINNIVFKVI